MNAIITIALSGIMSLYIGVFQWKKLTLPFGILACLAAFGIIVFQLNGDYSSLLNNMLVFDDYSAAFSSVMIMITVGVLVISRYYYRSDIEHLSDIYALFLFSLVGALTLVSFGNLVMLFLGLEIMSIPLYILAASNRKNLASNEAGLKYYVTGSFASCFLLLGITLVYGITGTFDVQYIATYLSDNAGNYSLLFIAGILLIVASFIFKVSAAPFHLWAPDVYQGSPTVITSFMATVIKIGAFGALLKIVSLLLPPDDKAWWGNLLSVIAVLTMVVGNVIALSQKNFKRLLAYSGIANAGYVMIAVACANTESYKYILFYMIGYSVATILAFAIYVIVKESNTIDDIDGFTGIAKKNKLLTVTLSLSMLSLSGIPPLAGFFGKYLIFMNAIDENKLWLVIVAIFNTVIGVFYYFRVMALCFKESQEVDKIQLTASYRIVLIGGILLLLLLGIFPSLVLDLL